MITEVSDYWLTWSGAAQEDAPISDEQAFSGSNSLLIEGNNGPVDILFPFSQAYQEGEIELSMMLKFRFLLATPCKHTSLLLSSTSKIVIAKIAHMEETEHYIDEIITTSAILHCDQQQAFNYFSESNLLTKWLTNKAVVEMIPAGKYELFWTPDDPDPFNNSTFGCKVLAVDKPHFFNIEWRGNAEQKGFMNNVRPLTNVTVLFSALGEQLTKVTLIHTGWRPGDDWDSARQYFIAAWGGAFKKLESIVNSD